MGGRRNRTIETPRAFPPGKRLRSRYLQQRIRRDRHGNGRQLRSHHPGRDDAGYDRTRNPAENQGGTPHYSGHHGHQERGGEHHGQGRRVEDRRLPHQTRESKPGAALDQEERPLPATGHRTDHGRLPGGIRTPLLGTPDGRQLRRLVQRLSPDHELGDRALRFDRPKHQGGHRIPEARSQPGVLQVRPPELLRLDQQARRNHPSHVAYAHAVEDLPGGRRESQDHAAADRQLPLRPVAVDFVAAAGLVRRGAGRLSCPRRPNTPAMPFSPA